MNTLQPEVTSKDLEEKGSLSTPPEVDEEFNAHQEAVIDGVSISQKEKNSKGEVLQIKTVDKMPSLGHRLWRWISSQSLEK